MSRRSKRRSNRGRFDPYRAGKGQIQSNPLLFPEFQVKLGKFFLDHELRPDALSRLFQRQRSYETAKCKTKNLHRINAFLINDWVINSERRPSTDDLAALFKTSSMRQSVKQFCESNLTMEIEYAPCTRSKKETSFKPLKLIISQEEGNLWAICPTHGMEIRRSRSWCYSKSYNTETPVQPAWEEALKCTDHTASSTSAKLQQYSEKIVEELSLDPLQYAISLFGKKLLSKRTFDQVQELNETNQDKATRIYRALLNSVDSPSKYRKLIAVMEKDTELVKELKNDS